MLRPFFLMALAISSVSVLASEPKAKLRFKPLDPVQVAEGYSASFNELEDLCYTGDVADIGFALDELSANGTVSDWETVLAIRVGDQRTEIRATDQFELDDAEELMEIFETEYDLEEYGHPDMMEWWNAYDRSSDTVYVLTNSGYQGDGTELYGIEIPRCSDDQK